MRPITLSAFVLLAILILGLGVWFAGARLMFGDIDRCLDSGGVWNYEEDFCRHADSASSLKIDLGIEDERVSAKFRNSTDAPIELEEFFEPDDFWPPAGLQIRLRDSHGQLIRINSADEVGWWSPLATHSTLILPSEVTYHRLEPNESFTVSATVEQMLHGLNVTSKHEMGHADSCTFQLRAIQVVSRTDPHVEAEESPWMPIACERLNLGP